MAYQVRFKDPAAHAIRKLSHEVRRRVFAKAESLAANPRPPGVEKLKGEDNLYRVRVGDYRIVYTIQDNILLVLIVKVGHRREVYR